MRVAVYYNNKDIRIEERPIPKVGKRELLVKVMASGICGSDVMEWYRIKRAPLVLGHEIAGQIVEVGEEVSNYKIGDRVFVSHHVPCNKCRYCLAGHHTVCETLHTTNFYPGGFSEYVLVPEINVNYGVILLPEEVSYEEGTFLEPLGCVIRGQRLAGGVTNKTVAVLGSGISGLLHIALARVSGAAKIISTDVSEHRLEYAKKFGADVVIDANEDVPKRIYGKNDNRFADVVIICTGAYEAFIQGLESVDRGGVVLFFAPPDEGKDIPVPVNKFWRNSITLLTSYAASLYDLTLALDLIRNRKIPVKDMITHRLSLDEISLGFKLVCEAKDSIKVIIEPFR